MNKKILVIDDTRETAELISFILLKHGFEVETAVNGKEGLEKVSAFKPDLLVLDIMMPEIHGFDVIKILKENPKTKEVGIIVCSAKSYKPDMDLAKQLGAFGFVDKPFKKEDLIGKVNEFFNAKTG